MRSFLKNTRGAGTVIVTLLLIPAILLTGTAVDLASIYAARSLVNDGNQLALNGLLSDYDNLLRDLYGLYAVTSDDDEMQSIVNEYLSLTLFASEFEDEGRLLFNQASVDNRVTHIPASSIRTREILRHQIEEFVKLRAPGLFIEGILDKIESFTKFLPDLNAVILKLELDREILLLEEFYQQFYYRIRRHDYYIYDLATDPTRTADLENMNAPRGAEVNMANNLTAILNEENMLPGYMRTMLTQKQIYEVALANLASIRAQLNEPLERLELLFVKLDELYDEETPDEEAIENILAEIEALLEEIAEIQSEISDLEDSYNEEANAARTAFYTARDNAKEIINSTSDISRAYSDNVLQSVQKGAQGGFGEIILQIENDWLAADAARVSAASDKNPTLGWLVDKGQKLANAINPVRWSIKAVAAVKKEEISKYTYGNNLTSIELYIENYYGTLALRDMIKHQTGEVAEKIEQLKANLDNCSVSLKTGFMSMLNEDPYNFYSNESLDDLITRVDQIYESVIKDTENAYFNRLGNYLLNPIIDLGSGNTLPLNRYAEVLSMEIEHAIPNDFNMLRSTASPKVMPYFSTLDSASPRKFLTYSNANPTYLSDPGLFRTYTQLYDQFGDDTYFKHLIIKLNDMFDGIFSNMFKQFDDKFKEYKKGIVLDIDGEWQIPSIVMTELSRQGTVAQAIYSKNQSNVQEMIDSQDTFSTVKFGGNGIGVLSAIIKLLDTAKAFLVNFSYFALEGFGLLDKTAMTVYGAQMFSNYTTKPDNNEDTSMRGKPFTNRVNYLLNSEQEYLFIGSRNATANLMATHGVLFAVRFISNTINGFFINSVIKLCKAVSPTIVGPIIMYAVLVFGETLVDMYELKTGNSIPIFKLEDDWTFGNFKKMAETLLEEALELAVKIPVTSVIQGLTRSPHTRSDIGPQLYDELYSLLNEYNPENNYSMGVIYSAAVRRYYGDSDSQTNKKAFDDMMDALTGQAGTLAADIQANVGSEVLNKGEKKIDEKIRSTVASNVVDKALSDVVLRTEYHYRYTEFYMEYSSYTETSLTLLMREDTYYLLKDGNLFEISVLEIEMELMELNWEEFSFLYYEENRYFITEVPLLDEDGKDGLGTKLLKMLIPKISYDDYMWIFLYLVPVESLADRIAHLITLNISNARLNSGSGADAIQLTERNLVDLSQAYTAFKLETDVVMRLLFMSSVFTEWGFTGPEPYVTTIVNARGY